MKKFISAVAVISIMMFMIGCTKGAGITAPLQANTSTSVPTAVTATATDTPVLPPTATFTATATATVTATSTSTITPVVNLAITSNPTILVIVKKKGAVVGDLTYSNNPAMFVGYKSGDVIQVWAYDQTSMVVIKTIASWYGAVPDERKSVPDGTENYLELPPMQ